MSDLTKWESAGNANELAAVFQSHMGSAVKPSGMLVNIGRIDGSADSAAVDAGSTGSGSVVGSLVSLVWGGIKFIGIAALACVVLLVAWRTYYQAKRHGLGIGSVVSRFAPGGTGLPTNASAATARGGAVQYDPLTTDVGDDFLENDDTDGHLEMQNTSTAYAAQKDEAVDVPGA